MNRPLVAALATVIFAGAAWGQTCGNDVKYNIPYKDTYVKSAHTAENTFRTMKPRIIPRGSWEEAKTILPSPVWAGHPKELEMYWRAWEIACRGLCDPEEGSGFVNTYIDTAYNGNIFMWDTSFILMFARYGARFFPFQETLNNFYAKQHPDGFICREIKADGADCFERYDPTSTGPNLMPWCEMVYYRQFGDTERLHKIFPALVAYYKWLRLNRTWQNGTYWSSGWGTGMDNMPRVPDGYNPIFSHGHMTWLDTNLQQLMTANQMLEMGFYIERWQEIEDFEDEARMLQKYISQNLWNDSTGFLHDQYADGSLCPTEGISAFWALHTPGVLSKERMDRLVSHLADTAMFARHHMVPSISHNSPKYRDNGRYWQGGVWPGTNYMVIDGLMRNGYRDLARSIALNHYNNVLDCFSRTGTFYEYYSPESSDPGFMARDEFVGWTGLAPIGEFIEFILGIRGDYTKKEITWDMSLLDEHGLDRYPFGPDGSISLRAAKRSKASDEPRLTIDSNIPFKLRVLWGDGKEKIIDITPENKSY